MKSSIQAVFIHAGWRTGSTYLWNKFRNNSNFMAFCEPFHEKLSTATEKQLCELTSSSWPSGHPPIADPYQREFLPLIRLYGVEGFHTDFVTDNYFVTSSDSDAQFDYLQKLISLARYHGKVPAFKCCRTLGRSPWFKRRFPHLINIVLIRNPISQWTSMLQVMQTLQNNYFSAMNCMILGRARSEHAKRIATRLGIPTFSEKDYRKRYSSYVHFAAQQSERKNFHIFLYLYVLSYVAALPNANLVVDIDLLSNDQTAQKQTNRILEELSGASIDLSDASISDHRSSHAAKLLKSFQDEVANECFKILEEYEELKKPIKLFSSDRLPPSILSYLSQNIGLK